MKKVLLILLFCIFHSWNGKAQADFYSLQPLVGQVYLLTLNILMIHANYKYTGVG